MNLRAAVEQSARCSERGRAVAAIDGDSDSGVAPEALVEQIEIWTNCVERVTRTSAGASPNIVAGDVSDLLGQQWLRAVGQQLEAVVLGRIVARGHDQPAAQTVPLDAPADHRRRSESRGLHIDAGSERALDGRFVQLRGCRPRVVADDH